MTSDESLAVGVALAEGPTTRHTQTRQRRPRPRSTRSSAGPTGLGSAAGSPASSRRAATARPTSPTPAPSRSTSAPRRSRAATCRRRWRSPPRGRRRRRALRRRDGRRVPGDLPGGPHYVDVSIPLPAADDSVFRDRNDGFDFLRLLEVAVAGPTGPGYSVLFDDVTFSAGLSPNPTRSSSTVALTLPAPETVRVEVPTCSAAGWRACSRVRSRPATRVRRGPSTVSARGPTSSAPRGPAGWSRARSSADVGPDGWWPAPTRSRSRRPVGRTAGLSAAQRRAGPHVDLRL